MPLSLTAVAYGVGCMPASSTYQRVGQALSSKPYTKFAAELCEETPIGRKVWTATRTECLGSLETLFAVSYIIFVQDPHGLWTVTFGGLAT